MKALIFISFCLYTFVAKAQFSESFFELMGTSEQKVGHYFGTETSNGILGVRLADSAGTEVQFAKLDLNGNYETFSANFVNDYISPNERIIELFEVGTNQFLILQDSMSQNNEGLRIYKFENYTENVAFLNFPVELRNLYFQAYYKFGKLYIFYHQANVGLKRLKLNPANLQIEENLLIGSFPTDVQWQFKHFKQTHVLFQDESNMQVFSASNTNLARINIVNNVVSPVEFVDLGLSRVLGINPTLNQVICYKFSQDYPIKKYSILSTQPLSSISLVDSLYAPIHPISFFSYANNNGNIEYVFAKDGSIQGNFFAYENSELVNSKQISSDFIISQFKIFNNKPLFFGSSILEHLNYEIYPFQISYAEFEDFYKFKEYNGIYRFGNFNVKKGLGPNFYRPFDYIAYGDFLFTNLNFASFLAMRGLYNGQIYGGDNGYKLGYYKPGPYTNVTQYDHGITHQFNEAFYMDVDMLNYHVYAIQNQIDTYVIPREILRWPAHGNANKGQAQNLAPFIDVNGDETYNPELGDYPSIPGTRCLLTISHQHQDDLNQTGLGVEIHSYLYMFDCNDTLSEVMFYRTEIFNRSSRIYDSLSVGVINDFDIGGYNDDFVGTHVDLGIIYGYNGDQIDEGVYGNPGFQDSLPTMGTLFLKGIKTQANGVDDLPGIGNQQTVNGFGYDDAVIDNEYKGLEYSFFFSSGANSAMNDPVSNLEYFNFLNGRWKYGDTLFYGGIGYYPNSTGEYLPTRFVYPSNSDSQFYGTQGIDPGFYWSEEQVNNPPSDRRILGSFGSTSLGIGEKLEYHFAMLSGKGLPGYGQSQLDLFAKAAHVKKAFNENQTACNQSFDNVDEEQITATFKVNKGSQVKLYPNPSNSKITILLPEGISKQHIHFVDINGKICFSTDLLSNETTLDLDFLEIGL